MKKLLIILIAYCLFPGPGLHGQTHYEVSRAAFSSSTWDEFCPALYGGQIVFCSNQEYELLLTHKNPKNKALFSIFTVSNAPEGGLNNPVFFSEHLVTPFNDGPVSFHPDSTLMVYSRNLDIAARRKNLLDQSNKLGLYFAGLENEDWIPISAFPYNSKEYSLTFPCFSPDGRYLYFSSDMPGGIGGADLYRSEWVDDTWGLPENLGPEINTPGNEVYPFISGNGDLFFASDGHPGLGKKDIFRSGNFGTGWTMPTHLEAPINSTEDDFGLITDASFSKGYFSTDREGTDDIYRFSTLFPQLIHCDTLLENNYCFEFWDELYPGTDSMPVTYEWEFSDGTKKEGLQVEHCLPGAGKYWARLHIIDSTTSNIFFSQSSMEFEISDYVQPFITSADVVKVNTELAFSGLDSNIPDQTIEEYFWELGDGTLRIGPEISHSYQKPGIYDVKLGLKVTTDGNTDEEIRCIVKQLTVVPDNQALGMFLSGTKPISFREYDWMARDSGNDREEVPGLAMEDEIEVFRIEILSSDYKLDLDYPGFEPLQGLYNLREFYLPADSAYSYAIGEYHSLPETYAVYNDLIGKGFTEAKVKSYVVADLPTEVIARINRDFAEFTDALFEFNQSGVSVSSYPLLNQLADILIENPELALEIAAHTDHIGSQDYNLELSQRRAQSIVEYLVNSGVDRKRMTGKGYGESRPIASNSTEEGRMQNRRVEFIIIDL